MRLLLLVSLLLLAGCAASPAGPSESPDPRIGKHGHEHAAFRVFAEGVEVSFTHPKFDLASTGYVRAHLHLGGSESTHAQYVIHGEAELAYRLSDFFDSLGVETSHDRVRLNEEVQEGREYQAGDGKTWQLWVDACKDGPDNWQHIDKFPDYRPWNHDRMLITFAPKDATADSLAEEFVRIPTHAQLEEQLKESCEKTY